MVDKTKKIQIIASQDELWLMQKVVRHEMADQGKWEIPPVSKELNEAVAEALVFSTDQKQNEVHLSLTEADTFVLDFVIPADAKNAQGVVVGRLLLLKIYRARLELSRPYPMPQLLEEPKLSYVAQDVIDILIEKPQDSEEPQNA